MSSSSSSFTPNQNKIVVPSSRHQDQNHHQVMSASASSSASPMSFMIHSNITSRRGGSSRRKGRSSDSIRSSTSRRRSGSRTSHSSIKTKHLEEEYDHNEGITFERQNHDDNDSSSSPSSSSAMSSSSSSNDIPSLSYSLSPYHSPLFMQQNLNSSIHASKQKMKTMTSPSAKSTAKSLSSTKKRKHSLSLSITPQKNASQFKSPMSSNNRKIRTKRMPLSPLPQNNTNLDLGLGRGGGGRSNSLKKKKKKRHSFNTTTLDTMEDNGIMNDNDDKLTKKSNNEQTIVMEKSFSSLDYSVATSHDGKTNHDDDNNNNDICMSDYSKEYLRKDSFGTKDDKVNSKISPTSKTLDDKEINNQVKLDQMSNNMNEHEHQNESVNKDISSKAEESETTARTIPKQSHRSFNQITIPFPSNNDDIQRALGPKSLRKAYKQALKSGTHQRSLKESGCNTLSLDEVLLPTIIASILSTIRTMIGKARGKADIDQVNQLQFMRCILMTCNQNVSYHMRQYREDSSKQRQEDRQQQKQARIEQKQLQKKARLEQKIQQRKINREKRKKERKKNLVKNKELWREVMVLMTDLSRLEKEEKMWDGLDVESVVKDPNTTKNIVPSSGTAIKISNDNSSTTNHAEVVEQSVSDIISDVTVAANRINGALSSIHELMNESKNVQLEMNAVYKRDHKFYGYLGVKDPKALVRGLML